MEELIRRGTPQRTAHEWVGRLVRKALDRGLTLAELPAADFQEIDPSLDGSLHEALGVDRAIARFKSYGSTAPAEVAKQVGGVEGESGKGRGARGEGGGDHVITRAAAPKIERR